MVSQHFSIYSCPAPANHNLCISPPPLILHHAPPPPHPPSPILPALLTRLRAAIRRHPPPQRSRHLPQRPPSREPTTEPQSAAHATALADRDPDDEHFEDGEAVCGETEEGYSGDFEGDGHDGAGDCEVGAGE